MKQLKKWIYLNISNIMKEENVIFNDAGKRFYF